MKYEKSRFGGSRVKRERIQAKLTATQAGELAITDAQPHAVASNAKGGFAHGLVSLSTSLAALPKRGQTKRVVRPITRRSLPECGRPPRRFRNGRQRLAVAARLLAPAQHLRVRRVRVIFGFPEDVRQCQ
ncbi:hypothetical protein MRX96_037204 [Rhipicephalus microplus]